MELHIKKLHPDAKLPTYAHPGDAGMDLYTYEDTHIPAHGRVLVPSGIAMAIPDGYVGLVWDKSGVSYKAGLKVIGGVADAGYRGQIFVGILNTTDEEYVFEKGDKVAQMLIQKVERPDIIEVNELDETSRGDRAFGSTGK
jgi:dUTP pyrophosphatase